MLVRARFLVFVLAMCCLIAGTACSQAQDATGASDPGVRNLLVIGDSISLGYGVLGDGPHCSGAPSYDDPGSAYPAILARRLEADLHIRARSGMGLVRNFGGSNGETAMELLDRTGFPESIDVAIVHLGTNDFYQNDPGILFENTYDELLEDLRSQYPAATILLLSGPMLNGDDREKLDAAVSLIASRQQSGGADVRHVLLANSQKEEGRYGCDWHPGVATQSYAADVILEQILPEQTR